MKFKVTVYSNWEKTQEHIFTSEEEAKEFSKTMQDHQCKTFVDELDELDELEDTNEIH
jgi:hypothetical protein